MSDPNEVEWYGGRMFRTEFLDEFLDPDVAPTADQFNDLKAADAVQTHVDLFNKVIKIFDKFDGGNYLSRNPDVYALLVGIQEKEIAKHRAAIQDPVIKAKIAAYLERVELWKPHGTAR